MYCITLIGNIRLCSQQIERPSFISGRLPWRVLMNWKSIQATMSTVKNTHNPIGVLIGPTRPGLSNRNNVCLWSLLLVDLTMTGIYNLQGYNQDQGSLFNNGPGFVFRAQPTKTNFLARYIIKKRTLIHLIWKNITDECWIPGMAEIIRARSKFKWTNPLSIKGRK